MNLCDDCNAWQEGTREFHEYRCPKMWACALLQELFPFVEWER